MSTPAPYPNYDDRARCRQLGVDPEWFHPKKGENNATTAGAKRLCNGWPSGTPCPFRDECREYSLSHSVHGIWGGWAEDQRKRERKRRRIVPQPLSMTIISAAGKGRPMAPRADHGALAECEICGREMVPQNLSRHRRTQHPEPGEMAS